MKHNPVPTAAAACAALVLGTFALRAAGPAPDATPAPTSAPPSAEPAAPEPPAPEPPAVSLNKVRRAWDREAARDRKQFNATFYVPEGAEALPREELARRFDELLHDPDVADLSLCGRGAAKDEAWRILRERVARDPAGVADVAWAALRWHDDSDPAADAALFEALAAARAPFPRLSRIWAELRREDRFASEEDRRFYELFRGVVRVRAMRLLDLDDWDAFLAFSRRFEPDFWAREIVLDVLPLASSLSIVHDGHKKEAWLRLYEAAWRDLDRAHAERGYPGIDGWMACYEWICRETGQEDRFRRTLETTGADPEASPAWRLACLWNLPDTDDPAEEDRRYRAFAELAKDPSARTGLELPEIYVFLPGIIRYRRLEREGRTNELAAVEADLEAIVTATPVAPDTWRDWAHGDGVLQELGCTSAADRVGLVFAQRWSDALPVEAWGAVHVPADLSRLDPALRQSVFRRLLHDERVRSLDFEETADGAADRALRAEAQAVALADATNATEAVWSLDDGTAADDAFFDALAAARGAFARFDAVARDIAGAGRNAWPGWGGKTPDGVFHAAFADVAVRHRALRALADGRTDRFDALLARFGEEDARREIRHLLFFRPLPDFAKKPSAAWEPLFADHWREAMAAKAGMWETEEWFSRCRFFCGDGFLLRLLDGMEAAPDATPDWRLHCAVERWTLADSRGEEVDDEAAARRFVELALAGGADGPLAHGWGWEALEFCQRRCRTLAKAGRTNDLAAARADLERVARAVPERLRPQAIKALREAGLSAAAEDLDREDP